MGRSTVIVGAMEESGAKTDLTSITEKVGIAKTSFYQAMRILPKQKREAIYAIYAFCRDVDDIADEPETQDEKRRGLASWRTEIDAIYAGGLPQKTIGRALVEPARHYGLLKQDFLAVIDGMEMDAEHDIRAPSAAELDLYCARVAGAVGRLSVRVFGTWRARADDVADQLGRALQLTNILRDLDEDAERGRLYLPREVLELHGIMTTVPAAVLSHPQISAVCEDIAEQALEHFATARAAMADCSRADMRPAAMMAGIYHLVLEKLLARGWASPREPISIPKFQKLWVAFRAGFLWQ